MCGFHHDFRLTASRYRPPSLPPLAQQILNKKRGPARWSWRSAVRRPVLHAFSDVTELLHKSPNDPLLIERHLKSKLSFQASLHLRHSRIRDGDLLLCAGGMRGRQRWKRHHTETRQVLRIMSRGLIQRLDERGDE
ncbi:hypothetical protein ATANTOWER_003161 [Ataeniobius toweri]|uniref:Uncharacterized protein n=1 Tax=Ataeniobius toweri TaxID=208326 RepID=A0ABU7BWG8_9TELE|nr:hypothetical protein [Ataeniobius toweri]